MVECWEHPDEKGTGAVALDRRLQQVLQDGGELVDGERSAHQHVL